MAPRKLNWRRGSLQRSPSAPPTIKDVAAQAGVSVATVSNVINGRTTSVSQLTREIVLREIERIGYRPQSGARSLRTMRSRSLAMIVVDESELYLQDPFPAAVVAGFTARLNEFGYVTVLHGCRRDEFNNTAVVQRLGVDGYCLFLSGPEASRRDLVRHMASWEQPLVLIQESSSIVSGDVCVVRQDDYQGGVAVGAHLLERNVKRVALISPELDWPAVIARFDGIRDTFRNSNSRIKLEKIITIGEGFDVVVKAVGQRLREGPLFDAVVAPNDQTAIAAMQALRDRGISIPEESMVVGFNGLEFWRYCTPRLTTVRSSPYQIGEHAALALVERIDKGQFKSYEIVLPVHFQQGETTTATIKQAQGKQAQA